MSLSDILNDNVTLLKKNGKRVEGIKANVQSEVISHLTLNVFGKRPVRTRRSDASVQGVVGAGVSTPGYPINLHFNYPTLKEGMIRLRQCYRHLAMRPKVSL